MTDELAIVVESVDRLARLCRPSGSVRLGLVISSTDVDAFLSQLPDRLRESGIVPLVIASADELRELLLRRAAPPPPPAVSFAALLTELQKQQQAAQSRVAEARQQNLSPDPFDRDAGTWLAAGLRDLLDDPIAGASFRAAPSGIFSRLNADPATRFSEADFLRPDGIRFMEASRAAQSMLTKLTLSSTNQYRLAAARLANRAVEELTRPASVVAAELLFVIFTGDLTLLEVGKLDDSIGLLALARTQADLPNQLTPVRIAIPDPTRSHDPWDVDFINRLDCEGLLRSLALPDHQRLVERLHEAWASGQVPFAFCPRTIAEANVAEEVCADLQALIVPDMEVPSFSALVDSGYATLELIADDLPDWLLAQVDDLREYRIVRDASHQRASLRDAR